MMDQVVVVPHLHLGEVWDVEGVLEEVEVFHQIEDFQWVLMGTHIMILKGPFQQVQAGEVLPRYRLHTHTHIHHLYLYHYHHMHMIPEMVTVNMKTVHIFQEMVVTGLGETMMIVTI